jgi:hypothetical protein
MSPERLDPIYLATSDKIVASRSDFETLIKTYPLKSSKTGKTGSKNE